MHIFTAVKSFFSFVGRFYKVTKKISGEDGKSVPIGGFCPFPGLKWPPVVEKFCPEGK